MSKKIRAGTSPVSRKAERMTSVIVEKFLKNGFFDEEGKPVAPVIHKYIHDNCSDYRLFHNPLTNEFINMGGDKLKRHPLDTLLAVDEDFLLFNEKLQFPQRWQYTSDYIKRHMYLDALRCTGVPHRPLCFWISRDIVEEAISKKANLAAWMLKRISERLKRLLGGTEFGLWFHLEHKPGEPEKVHAHGLIYIADESWFEDKRTKYRAVRDEIRTATGFLPNIGPDAIATERWVHTQNKPLNHGYIDYCVKSRRERTSNERFNISNLMPNYVGVPSLEIGNRIEAVSHTLSRRSKSFYEAVLPVVRGFMTGEVYYWNARQWEAIGATEVDGLVELPV
jgi:hypothetical protein